ncbi:MAG TPA: class I SAM-dependent methyltransferase [Candidatus Omnitrophota bacterium]|nr:class I SAM-dependent methyltransferase [Candidatus Omnitrophota bacterium]
MHQNDSSNLKFLPKGFVTPEKAKYQAQILANRIRKRFQHLSRRFKREGIECFRLYDWDIKEVRAVVDWYAGHVVIGEYVRLQTGPDWLPQMAKAVAEALNIPLNRVHLRRRQTNTKEGPRYRPTFRVSEGKRFEVRERDLRFWVNMEDFLDTGLFSDHRDTRVIVRNLSSGKDFLNLFAYTGSFTCAAAAGRARSAVTVDRSENYLNWAKDNLKLNGLEGPQHSFVQLDAGKFLERAFRDKHRFTLAFVDPPSFFQDRSKNVSFDVNLDHPELIRNVLKVMAPGSFVFFSTNHQRFEPRFEGLNVHDLTELTPATIPEDYRNRSVHRCWRMTA